MQAVPRYSIKEFAKIVHEAGALICVDGVAYAPHRRVDVLDLGVDFYTFSWYKVYFAHLAMMYGKLDLLTRMKGINHYFFKNEDVPYKFQPGNFNFELTFGLKGLLEYLKDLHDHHSTANISSEKEKFSLAFSLIAEYEEDLTQPLLKYLNSVPEVKIIGEISPNAAKRVPTISFIHEKMKSPKIVAEVDKEEIGIRFGDFYTKKLIHDLEYEKHGGVVRVILMHYKTADEIQKLITVFKKIFDGQN